MLKIVKQDKIARDWAKRVKTIRVAVRLKHANAADDELNEVLSEEQQKFTDSVHRGVLPPPIDSKVLHG